MALLDADRDTVWGRFMFDLSNEREALGTMTKNDLRDGVSATDAWIDANAASYNQALPPALRTGLTTSQKARLFMAVAARRFEVE